MRLAKAGYILLKMFYIVAAHKLLCVCLLNFGVANE